MAKRRAEKWARFLAALLCCALLLVLPLPVAASSSTPSSTSGDDSSTSETDSSVPAEERESEPSVLAEPGRGLYVPNYEPMAEAYCLMNEDTGLFVSEKNADTPMVTASLVKMMTCILVIEHMEFFGKDLASTIVDSNGKSWVYDYLAEFRQSTGGEPSHADIRQGEQLSVQELLYAALLPSANEAALLLADYVSTGYMTNFLYMMNTRAQSLGCTGTWFADACGLSDQNITTARDMALITKEFMSHPALVEIAQAGTFQIDAHERHANPYTIHNTNRLVIQTSPYYSQYPRVAGTIVAGKTGSLGEWQNFASKATKNGESYICVVLHSPYEADTVVPTLELETPSYRPALVESAALYNWAFSSLTVRPALDTEQPVTELKVNYSSDQAAVRLMPSGDVKVVLPVDAGEELIKRRYELPDSVSAPVEEGTVLGNVVLSVGNQVIGSAELMAEKNVERNETLYVLNRTGDFFTSTYIKVLLVLILVAAAAYAGIIALAHNARKRQKQQARAGVRGAASVQRRAPSKHRPSSGQQRMNKQNTNGANRRR